jgi:D-lactate dehydrogenase
MKKEFEYQGADTCAGDGLCATLCPVGIDTGAFIKNLREAKHSRISHFLAAFAADHFSKCLDAARIMLATGHLAQRCIGVDHLSATTRWLRKAFGRSIPQWNAWAPKPVSRFLDQKSDIDGEPVVYFPSCVGRVFGVSDKDAHLEGQSVAIAQLLSKAGCRAVYPAKLEGLCCGMAFASKGYSNIAQQKTTELISALQEIGNGDHCVVVDTSPCAMRLQAFATREKRLRIYDISRFLLERVVPRVQLNRKHEAIAVHVPCSLKTAGEDHHLLELAHLCAEKVYVSSSSPCCGFAGDRGFTHPELTASALVRLGEEIPRNCPSGYSSSRTCELGASLHSGISFQSIAYLLRDVIGTN